MIIGIPKEIKEYEFRVGATPAMVRTLAEFGHKIFVEKNVGAKIGYSNEMFKAAGAKIIDTPADVYKSEMIIKVKEPQDSEFQYLYEGQILYCYLHLAPDPVQTEQLIESKVVAIAYETVTAEDGSLPLLTPMSEVAGRLSIQAGAYALQKANGGRGILL
ncbi:MAG: alanine dehydrogenase, partial [Waddliaceae bacterium]